MANQGISLTTKYVSPVFLALEMKLDQRHPDKTHWCYAKLALCHVDYQNVLFQGDAELKLDEPTGQAIAKQLEAYAADHGISLYRVDEHLWLVAISKHDNVKFVDYDAALGRPLQHCMPKGVDAAYWHQVLTDSQMMLQPLAHQWLGHPTLWFWRKSMLSQHLARYMYPFWRLIRLLTKNKDRS